MLNDKVLKLNNILNEIFKKIVHIIKNDLTLTINKCFISDVTLKIFCKFITVILRKKKKKEKLLTVKQLLLYCTEKHNYKAYRKASYEINS